MRLKIKLFDNICLKSPEFFTYCLLKRIKLGPSEGRDLEFGLDSPNP